MCGRFLLDPTNSKEIEEIIRKFEAKNQEGKTGKMFPTNTVPLLVGTSDYDNERGFTPEIIDAIIDNNTKTRKSKIDELGRKTWEYIDSRGNKVVTNDRGGIVSVHSSAPKGKYIPK